MKRVVLLLGFGLVCMGVTYYAAPRYVAARKTADQNAAYARMLAENGPLVLDRATQAVLANADRVETFRLRNPNEDYDEQDMPKLIGPHVRLLDQCEVMRVGPSEHRAVAAALQAALSKVPSPVQKNGQFSLAPVGSPNDFGADIGFRVWKGKAHVDVCVGLYTNFVEITTEDAYSKPLAQTTASLGASRPAFIALSKQAFPQDKTLAALE